MQTVWKGVISFGLVSIPVQLFAATEEHSVSFRQIHASDGGQIRYRRVCTLDDEEVSYGDIARGYELPDGEVVVLTDEDFAQLPLVTSRAIEVLGFADADSVDPVRLSRSYYCDPTGSDTKGYVLLREALRRTGQVALVKSCTCCCGRTRYASLGSGSCRTRPRRGPASWRRPRPTSTR
jgi:DNA end-binding protein Ku